MLLNCSRNKVFCKNIFFMSPNSKNNLYNICEDIRQFYKIESVIFLSQQARKLYTWNITLEILKTIKPSNVQAEIRKQYCTRI